MPNYYYTIGSIYDDEQRFPGLCAAHLFDQLHMKNNILVRYQMPKNYNKSFNIIESYARRDDVEYTCCEFKRYTAIMLYFKKTIDTNLDIVPLLSLDSLDTQYIVLNNPDYAEILKNDWYNSQKKEIAKFACSINQWHELLFSFSDKYYDYKKVEEELKKWEQRIPEITGMQHMKRKDEYGNNIVIEISLH